MAKLDDLPDELVDAIVHHCKCQHRPIPIAWVRIDLEERRRTHRERYESAVTLRNLRLTSRRLNQLAEAAFYEAWGTGGSKNDQPYTEGDLIDRIQRFLLTIWARPHLALHVKYVEAMYYDYWDYHRQNTEPHTYKFNWFTEASKPFFKRLGELHSPKWTAIISALKARSVDAYIALLLSHLPNLEELSYDVPPSSEYCDELVHLAGVSGDDPAALQRVKMITIRSTYPTPAESNYPNNSQFDFSHMRDCYLHLPSLQHAWVDRCDGSFSEKWLPQPRQLVGHRSYEFTRLKTLELRHTGILPEALKPLLNECKGLQSFSLSLGATYSGDRLPGLSDALLPLKSTLRHLQVTQGLQNDRRLVSVSKTLGSLRDFENLVSLDVCIDFLLGSEDEALVSLPDVLPPAVKGLVLRSRTIYWQRENLIPQLWAPIGSTKDQLQSLRTIDMWQLDWGCEEGIGQNDMPDDLPRFDPVICDQEWKSLYLFTMIESEPGLQDAFDAANIVFTKNISLWGDI